MLIYRQSQDEVIHSHFDQIGQFLPESSVLAINQSKVFPCRLLVKKSTGGKGEIFVLTPTLDQYHSFVGLIKTSGKKRIGDVFLDQNSEGQFKITELLVDGTFKIQLLKGDFDKILHESAKIPIPPYIRDGESDEADKVDYQTVFAKVEGSVAAPTAGLHFTPELMDQLKSQGHDFAPVVLHVGLGTFRPVKAERITDHHMHEEKFFIEKSSLDLLNSQRPVIAVGTTSLRTLESSFDPIKKNYRGDKWSETSIFLYPGIPVHSIQGLITNFHLPESTLLMLVSAILGREKTLELYRMAVQEKYRFFSYGDAMLILR
ncbi:MAG: tRNA preQ1(34) S-adenosylmethionine ribosyltransferase-isomerase QueA [Bacteriovoracaceae bacterium]